VDRVEKRIVGVNVHVADDVERVEIIPANPEYEREQGERLAVLRRDRDNERVRAALAQQKTLRAESKTSCIR
jgi:methylmalonyl-CoA mutase N-terminal domain/subunit